MRGKKASRSGETTAGTTGTTAGRSTRAVERKRRNRRRIASGTVLSLVAGTVVAASLLHDGVATADVELNDGGVWVTNGSELLVGRVNYPVQQLDGSVTSASNEIDVLQEGSTVLVADSGVDLLSSVDPATVSTDAGGVTLPADHQVGLGGGVVGVLDLGSGNLRTAPAHATGTLADEEAPPQASLGANAELAVGKDGTAYGLSTTDSVVVTVPRGTEKLQAEAAAATEAGETAEPVELDETGIGIDPADFSDADTQLTVVGETPVVLTRTADERLLLGRPGADPTDLTDLGLDLSQVRLQHPGEDSDDVVLASADALVRVPLDGGDPVTLRAPAAGRPAAPVVVAGCVHAAWAGAESHYLQQCGRAEAVEAPVPTTAGQPQLEFRTNRDLVVLNDTLAGTVYLVNESMTIVENWDDVTPPDATDELEEESQQDITDEIPLDREAENRPPVAEDDRFGVRAGSTTIIEVLANDTDPDGDLLAIGGVEGFPAGLGEIREVLGGRALQVSAPPGATGSGSFSYTVDDGRGGEATASVALRVVPEAENTAPEQLRPIRLTVTSGATGSVNVLTHMRDADGDEMLVTGATAPADDVVRFTPDGAVEFVDSGVTTGAKAVPVTVSDGRESTEVTVEVDVREEGNLPPVPVFDYFRATAGEEVEIEPIVNDTDPDGEPLRLADVRTQGDATVVPDYDAGSFRFTAETAGSYYLTYVVVDDSGKDATGLVRVEVTDPADGAPVAVQDTALLPAGGAVLVDVLANDEDPSGRLLAVQQVTVPPESGLVVSVLEHRILKISARQVPSEPLRFGYTVSNGDSSAEGEVVVMPVATDSALQPPVAEADTATVRAGDFVTIPVLQNDSHPAGLEFELDAELAEAPDAAKGHFFVSGETVRFRAPAQPQTVNAVYRVVDSAGNEASAQVTVHVQADAERNSAPLPHPIETRAFSGERIRIQVPLFGIDPDGDSVQLLGTGEAPQLGRIVEVGPGYLDYEAYGHLDGTDQFTYTVRDRLGMVASAPVRIGVVPPPQSNRAPDAQDDAVEVRPGREVSVDVLTNDTDPDGDPLYLPTGELGVPFDPVEGVDISVENGMLKILSPEEPTVFTVAYRATDNRGGQDTGLLEVKVSPDAPLLPPLARDDLVQAADIIDHDSVTVPVLENDEDPDGTAEALRVTVPDAPEGVSVVDNQVQAPVRPDRQVITYQVQDVDGNVGFAFVDIPGVEDTGPVLRTDAEPIEVLTGQTVEIPIADYVVSPSGKDVRLTDGASVTATNSNGASPVVDATTLSYTSAPGYAGPAALTFEVTDGASAEDGLRSVLTLPITVLPDGGNTPPTFAGGSVEVSPAEEPVTLNLRNLVQDPDTADFNQLDYRVVDAGPGVEASIDGTFLSVSAPADTPAGSQHEIVISVADPVNEPVTGTVTATVVPSTRPPAGVQDRDLGTVDQGETQTVDVLAGAYNPFPGEPLTVVDAYAESGTADVSFRGGQVTVTPGAEFVGRAVVLFVVEDATGDARRHVEGRLTMNVVGVPERPTPPRVEDVRDRTVVLAWTAPANNGSPISGYTVETSGSTTQCATTTCTISGLTNNVEYTFTVTATNAVGDSEPSGASAVARPDVKPERPAPPVLAFGDGELVIEWTAPPTSGSPVESYDLMISPAVGSGQINVTGTSHTWSGLKNGTAYRVQVRARNQAPDPSEWSGWSAAETPAGVPAVPAAPRVQRVDDPVAQQITAAWEAPDANGAAVSEYRVQIFRDGSPFRDFTTAGTSFQEDAPAGSDYTVTVAAKNKAGWSETSATSQPVRSFARPSAPGTPTATATGSDGVVQLEFTNAQPNGDPVTGYQVSVNGGGWQSLPADRKVTGLNDGSSYSFRVRAMNSYAGETSGTSNTVVPYGPMGNPTMTASNTGEREITFRWSSPDGNGREITSTQIRYRVNRGAWSGWQNVPATGSSTQGGQWSTEYEAQFQVVRSDGVTRSVNATGLTYDEPRPDPTVRVAKGAPVSASDCSASACRYVAVDYTDLPGGSYNVTFQVDDGGWRNMEASTNGRAYTFKAGSGRLQTTMYYGWPGYRTRVIVQGNGYDLMSPVYTW
ncbi:Ig-like domain-containing protein [Georgenia daeguensis]|uniref:Ig-like domain-containing protein n=1 Tax=Georgenia daeguensis TaxID=908355 RepID=A0ABP8EQN6_9MICO